METFLWIVISSLIMNAIALVGSVTLILKEGTLKKSSHGLSPLPQARFWEEPFFT